MENSQKNGKKKKGIIAIVITVLLIAGGSAAAFMLNNLSPKQTYFLAEKETLEYISERFQERYQEELDWNEASKENPTEQTIELTAEYNDPASGGNYGGFDISQIINNLSVNLSAQTDMENKQIAATIGASLAGVTVEGLEAYITDEKLLVGLPFTEDYLQVKDEDFGPLMYELDPQSFTGEETLELDTIFEGNGVITEEDLEYFKKEYFEMVYKDLPDEAFTQSDESADVKEESLNAEKIEFHLTEEQLKDILTKVFDKLENDEKVKELLRSQMTAQLGGSTIDVEADQMISDFETAMADAKEGIQEFQIPNGFTSTIWVYEDKIVKRDLQFELGPNESELALLSVQGTQLLDDTNQHFNYDFSMKDSSSEGTMNLTGDLAWEDNQATDSIKLSVDGMALSYDGSETLKDGKRTFDRVFSFDDSVTKGSLLWDGSSTFEKDRMNAEHQFSVESPELGPDMLAINLALEGQRIDSIEMPSEENITDLGSMSAEELTEYMETELTPGFEQWLFGIMAGSGAGF
ncbi:DUF6583 family protein [Oceanobacillus piezotolerans]|uniref:DUF6583 family protein n=1 Tax=Oceanobacillus piezotolerans TaxID=2448030 RepID=UPI001FEAF586|nr:DUF6583 family protein [Oceanobacillus piezotolerans]